jgi:hypothetical protein
MYQKKRYWRVENVSEEDVPLKIRTWSGVVVEDVFHAGEVALVNNEGFAAIRVIDPLGTCFHVRAIIEEKGKVNWKEEGF